MPMKILATGDVMNKDLRIQVNKEKWVEEALLFPTL
jgi:hypothetical protein